MPPLTKQAKVQLMACSLDAEVLAVLQSLVLYSENGDIEIQREQGISARWSLVDMLSEDPWVRTPFDWLTYSCFNVFLGMGGNMTQQEELSSGFR